MCSGDKSCERQEWFKKNIEQIPRYHDVVLQNKLWIFDMVFVYHGDPSRILTASPILIPGLSVINLIISCYKCK